MTFVLCFSASAAFIAAKVLIAFKSSERVPDSSKEYYSLKDLACEGLRKGLVIEADNSWTIPANVLSESANYDLNHPEAARSKKFLVWSSRALDLYENINTMEANLKAIVDNESFIELKPQEPISPISASPIFQKTLRFSAGHKINPPALSIAPSRARFPRGISHRPPGKPRNPRTFNSRTMPS